MKSCGFRWYFAELDRGVLTVKRTVLQLGGKLHEEPAAKSKAGDRLVFLDAETADLLRAHHKAQLKARMKAGLAWQDNDLVFCQPDGRPWNPDHVSKRFRKLPRSNVVGADGVQTNDPSGYEQYGLLHHAC